MGILDKINSDMVVAMKAKDQMRTNVLRNLKSAIKYSQIERKASEMTDEDIIGVLSSVAKKHRDSIEQFESGGRNDLVAQEKGELEIVLSYLPQQMSAEEISSVVDAAVGELGASGPLAVGLVMKAIMPKVKGRADGKLVKELVTRRLS